MRGARRRTRNLLISLETTTGSEHRSQDPLAIPRGRHSESPPRSQRLPFPRGDTDALEISSIACIFGPIRSWTRFRLALPDSELTTTCATSRICGSSSEASSSMKRSARLRDDDETFSSWSQRSTEGTSTSSVMLIGPGSTPVSPQSAMHSSKGPASSGTASARRSPISKYRAETRARRNSSNSFGVILVTAPSLHLDRERSRDLA
jgi:hypothetical protein